MDHSIVQQLKQTNISVDSEKTKQRTEELWKNISTSTQKEVLNFLGLKVTSIYRAYKTGNISAKIVVALASVCNVNPYYLTGETDENEGCSDELIKEFLTHHGYSMLFDANSLYALKRNPDGTGWLDEEEDLEPTPLLHSDLAATIIHLFQEQYELISPVEQETIQNLSLDEAEILLNALFIRARTVNESLAVERIIKLLLITS